MDDIWRKFESKTGLSSSAQVLSYVVNCMNMYNLIYVKMSDIEHKVEALSQKHWMPSHIIRYVEGNLNALVGLNIKHKKCAFCGDFVCVFTNEAKGVNEMTALCGNKCKKYWRVQKKCSKGFFKNIRVQYKISNLTLMLFAMQRRKSLINKLTGSK